MVRQKSIAYLTVRTTTKHQMQELVHIGVNVPLTTLSLIESDELQYFETTVTNRVMNLKSSFPTSPFTVSFCSFQNSLICMWQQGSIPMCYIDGWYARWNTLFSEKVHQHSSALEPKNRQFTRPIFLQVQNMWFGN